jgi:hypothetical protein
VPEHNYDRTKRISALDRMLNSIETMVANGGLSSRQLKDLAGVAPSVFSTRRQEDIEPEEQKKDEPDDIYWDRVFSDPNDPEVGIGYDPKTKSGREMIEFSKALDEGRDPFAEPNAKEKAQREASPEREA